jgi:hypothetical protein
MGAGGAAQKSRKVNRLLPGALVVAGLGLCLIGTMTLSALQSGPGAAALAVATTGSNGSIFEVAMAALRDFRVRKSTAERRHALDALVFDPRWSEPTQRPFLCLAHFQSRRAILNEDGRAALSHPERATLPFRDLTLVARPWSNGQDAPEMGGPENLAFGLLADARWGMPNQRIHLCFALYTLRAAPLVQPPTPAMEKFTRSSS